MELNCRVIEDLLPLYYDGHCRNGSRVLVKAHLEKCEACQNLYKELVSSDIVEQVVFDEEKEVKKQDIVRGKFKVFRLVAYLLFGGITVALLIPTVHLAVRLLDTILLDLL